MVMVKKNVVKVFRVKMSQNMAAELDEMVNEGIYISYADAIRHGLDMLIEKSANDFVKEPLAERVTSQVGRVSSSSGREIHFLYE